MLQRVPPPRTPLALIERAGEEVGDPGWSWLPADTDMLLLSFALGSVGLFLALAILGASAFQEWLRLDRRAAQQERKVEASVEVSAVADDGDAAAALAKDGDADARPRWRVIALVLVGFSPLASCLLVGETLGNVLFAMVAMHWIAMLVLPALYYAVRSHVEEGFGAATLDFYLDLYERDHHLAFWKFTRGFLMGIPVFLCFLSGYTAFRCKTYGWEFCIRNFEHPLEQHGFRPHSMGFRLLAAIYFTFWNPFIEEFFWRVFLHRELGAELGLKRSPSFQSDAPWRRLWSDLCELLPTGAPDRAFWTSFLVCGGVSLMYASYHTWPMKVLFQKVWWAYTFLGFLFLACLGRFFLLLRESPDFGLPAAYALHAWVDAAFAVLVLVEIHPQEVLKDYGF